MKKTLKSKKAFTLIEMVLVIAIIVILAAVMLAGVGTYINDTHSAAAFVDSHNSVVYDISRSFMN